MLRKKAFGIFKNAIAWLISAIMLAPLILIFLNSLKNKYQADSMGFGLPKEIHLENFITVIEKGKLFQSFFNSMEYAFISIGIGTILTAMAAFVLARNKTKLNKFLYFFMVLGLTIPISFISLMKVMQFTHLINTRTGIIFLYTAMGMPFSLFLIYNFINSIPTDVDEAAIIDGSGPFRLFFQIIMPLLKPVIVTVVILNFMGTWNEFVFPLYFLNSSTKWPMTLAVYNFFGQYTQSWNLVCADLVLTSLPVLVIYLICQKYIVSGMTAGSVKE